MKKLDLIHIELELKKRWDYTYVWGRKQSNLWDGYTSFIYTTAHWEDLIQKIAKTVARHKLDKYELFNYASNRWYNFWSAMAIEQIFTEIEGINPVENTKDREKDFYLHGKAFDHKTSVFPVGFGKDISYVKEHELELITWLYKNQSHQQRFHLNNRLFIIVYDKGGAQWKLKARLSLIKTVIKNYMSGYHEDQLQKVIFAENKTALSDIIWVEQ